MIGDSGLGAGQGRFGVSAYLSSANRLTITGVRYSIADISYLTQCIPRTILRVPHTILHTTGSIYHDSGRAISIEYLWTRIRSSLKNYLTGGAAINI